MKKRNRKGFVLVETIIVISVLALGLISLYASYSLIMAKTTTKSKYDNSEFLYKTYFVKKHLSGYTLDSFLIKQIYTDNPNNKNEFLDIYNVEKVYLTKMDVNSLIGTNDFKNLDGNTINYIKSIKDYDKGDSSTRIIVKFSTGGEVKSYVFASLKY